MNKPGKQSKNAFRESFAAVESALLTRRDLLRAAGGITFLALLPREHNAFALPFGPQRGTPLLFTALPYLQHGSGSGVLSPDQESLVIAWQTNGAAAEFVLEYKDRSDAHARAALHQALRYAQGTAAEHQRRNYAATLTNLKLNTRYDYRLLLSGNDAPQATVVLEGYFTTRKPRGSKCHFVSFGDNSDGKGADRRIAYQAYRAKPDFVLNTGDNVYQSGLDHEYARYFFAAYNADKPAPAVGAPLLRSVPYYTVLGNHDVHNSDAQKHAIADFDVYPDSLAYYTNLYLPQNAPAPVHPTPMKGKATHLDTFRQCAGLRYPNIANYSFDYGDAHFLCLDANVYVDPTEPKLQAWIEGDLQTTDAAWKIIVYHHPPFNVGDRHYAEQHMRVLCPLLEKQGVSLVLCGHEHNYQRTRPLRFAPSDVADAKRVGSGNRLVPGQFTIDTLFDGDKNTNPHGIIYVVTGAGGNSLYDANHQDNPALWRHPEDNNVDYIARFVSDRHSFSVLDIDSKTLNLTQIDADGREIDHFRIAGKKENNNALSIGCRGSGNTLRRNSQPAQPGSSTSPC